MKNLFLLLFFVPNISFSRTFIEVNLKSFPNAQYSIKIDQSALNEYKGIVKVKGVTDSNGHFGAFIHLEKEQPITLFIGNSFFTLWAKPNSSLIINEYPDNHYCFSGASAVENQILKNSGLMQPYKTSSHVNSDTFNPERQGIYLDSIENFRIQTLKDNSKNNEISKQFQLYYDAEIYNYTFVNKNQYPALFKATGKVSDKDIPSGYFNFWEQFKLENDSTFSALYQDALQNFIEYKSLKKIGKSKIGTEQAWNEMFRSADSLLKDYPLSLQKQKTSFLLLLIKYFNFDNFSANEIKKYKAQFSKSTSISILESLLNKKKGLTSAIPTFQLKNPKGDRIDIKDFRGKIIYVDFWGSWCKACLTNMPHAKKLKSYFKSKDVAFLYINFFDTKEKWLSTIKKYRIDGIHLKAEKTDEEYFNKIFNINQGFPRYALIDKSGRLITISAPQPQNQEAYDLIQEYLKQ